MTNKFGRSLKPVGERHFRVGGDLKDADVVRICVLTACSIYEIALFTATTAVISIHDNDRVYGSPLSSIFSVFLAGVRS